jgi:2-dehydropantoate 2-reductase
MARVAVVGVGAIGSVVASLLQLAGGHEVVLCARRPLHGLTVQTSEGAVAVTAKVLTDPADAQPVDWVLVATKAYDVAGVAQWLSRLCIDGTAVAVLQNGVEHRERFAPYVSAASIVPVIVDCPVERRSAEDVLQRGPMSLKVPAGSLGEAFVGLFAGSKAQAEVVEDFVTVAWRKLCHNSAGALSALTLRPNEVLRDEALGEVARDMVRECVAVGRAEGAQLSDDVPEAVVAAYRSAAPDGVNSLLADRLAGRPMEVDARNGAIVRIGRLHNVPTPSNMMAVALLQAMTKAS